MRNQHSINNDKLFYIALFISIMQYYFQKSIFSLFDGYSYFNTVLKIAILLIICLKMLGDKQDRKTLTMLFLFLGTTVLVFLKSRYSELPVVVLFIFSAKGIPFEQILRRLLYFHCVGCMLIFLFYFVGIFPDYTYSHDGVIAHSWGFLYYSNVAFCVMTISILYIITRKELKVRNYIFVAVVNYIFYQQNTTKLTFYIVEFFIIIDIFINYISKKKQNKLSIFKIRKLSILIPVLCMALNMYIIYSSVNRELLSLPKVITDSLVSREEYSVLAIERYGISLFGNKLQMVGSYMIHYGGANEVGTNYYVDSGYLYILLGYGLFFTMLLFIVYGFLFYYLCSNNEVRLFSWLLIICIGSICNGLLLEVAFNPILFLTPVALEYSVTKYNSENSAFKKIVNQIHH